MKSAALLAVAAAPMALPGLVHAQTETPTKKLRIGIPDKPFNSQEEKWYDFSIPAPTGAANRPTSTSP